MDFLTANVEPLPPLEVQNAQPGAAVPHEYRHGESL